MNERLRTNHIYARHQHLESGTMVNELGDILAQGDVFPAYIKAGDINRFCKMVLELWLRFNRGQKVAEIIDYHQRSDGAYKVRVRFIQSQLGIKEVKSIIKAGTVVSISPARATGSSHFTRGSHQIKKASGYNNSLSGHSSSQV